ncbi:MAG: hypothetical protein M3Z66_04175 [Chloroflexota bacterium]|nr:hypothetical protein [Chloroflexota bacterium]
MDPTDDAGKVFSFLVADALEALVPLMDEWSQEVMESRFGDRGAAYAEGYHAGVRHMAAEIKDQLVERILRLRQSA